MIACLDVYYSQEEAHAAAVVFSDWTDTTSLAEYEATVDELAPYQPGQFYLRELQPLLAVIAKIAEPVHTYVIDGYCHLSADGARGLGEHLHAAPPTGDDYRCGEKSLSTIRTCRPTLSWGKRPTAVRYGRRNRLCQCGRADQIDGREFRIPTLIKAADGLSRNVVGDEPKDPTKECD